MREHWTRCWIACLTLWLVAAGFERIGDESTHAREPRDASLQGAVLILLDTVRADRLSSYGHARPTSPHLDALATRGVRFEQVVVAPSPWTLPRTAALLSAEHPVRIFTRDSKLANSGYVGD